MSSIQYSQSPSAQEVTAAIAAAGGIPQRIKDLFRSYLTNFVQYVKREKLSGQVLGKYTGRYDLLGGMKSGRMKSLNRKGSGKNSFGYLVFADGLSADIRARLYMAAWDQGFSRKQYTVEPRPERGPTARLLYYFNGAWIFAKKVVIPAQTFDAKPYIKPALEETKDRFLGMVARPLVKFVVDALRGVRG